TSRFVIPLGLGLVVVATITTPHSEPWPSSGFELFSVVVRIYSFSPYCSILFELLTRSSEIFENFYTKRIARLTRRRHITCTFLQTKFGSGEMTGGAPWGRRQRSRNCLIVCCAHKNSRVKSSLPFFLTPFESESMVAVKLSSSGIGYVDDATCH